jgi:hypothetical protein
MGAASIDIISVPNTEGSGAKASGVQAPRRRDGGIMV